MVEPLKPHAGAFAQDSHAWPLARAGRPGCRRVDGLGLITLRHRIGSQAARDAVAAQGLAWPEQTGALAGDLSSDGVLLVRCQPEQLIAVAPMAHPALAGLSAALAAGRSSDAVAIDLSHGMTVVALEGPALDDWLAHLIDAAAIPMTAGRASRARLIDIAVLLLRLAPDRVWLVADRAVSPDLANWLTFSHEGAFAVPRIVTPA